MGCNGIASLLARHTLTLPALRCTSLLVRRGTFVCKEGGYTYEGDWAQGRKQGRGSLRFPSGDTYLGEWHDDARHGESVTICEVP